MKIRFYCLVLSALTALIVNAQPPPLLPYYGLISPQHLYIGNTANTPVRITPAKPNNISEVETKIFTMPARGQGVMGIKLTLRGADGGTANYSEIGSTIVSRGGEGGTVQFTIPNLNSANPQSGAATYYGEPFIITWGKNGESGNGYYIGCAGAGGGSTGMAWLTPGIVQYEEQYTKHNAAFRMYAAIAAGGGGGERVNANHGRDGNGGGVITNNNGLYFSMDYSTCPPYSIEVVAGSSQFFPYPALDGTPNDCERRTISGYFPVMQFTFGGNTAILTSVTLGQQGGEPCVWTQGPPQSGQFGNSSTLCGGTDIQGRGTHGGAGYTGGGAGSAFLGTTVCAGGGGTGTYVSGTPGLITSRLGATSWDSQGGENYLDGHFTGTKSNGGKTATPASGYFEYQTIADTIAPVIVVKNDTLYLDDNGIATVTAADVVVQGTDNDSIQRYAFSPSNFGCGQLGVHTVQVTAYDFAGNTAVAPVTITVMDKRPPHLPGTGLHVLLPTNIDVAYGPHTITQNDLPVVEDNCTPGYAITYAWSATTYSCSQLGQQQVNYTVTDQNGNSSVQLALFNVYNGYLAQTIYVDASATGANNGFTWQDAFTDLQSALNVSCNTNRTIYVAQGTYLPDHGVGATVGDRSASFTLRNGDKIYGGFANGGDVFDNRNPSIHPVYLSGEIGTVAKTDNSYSVVTIPGTSANTVLDGVSIIAGYGNQNAGTGGGVHIVSTDAQLMERAAFNNCTFGNNYATNGGAVSFNDSAATGSLRFSNCLFKNNEAATLAKGGAIYVTGSGQLTTGIDIANSIFIGNRAGQGGALYYADTKGDITNASFGGNYATAQAGALYITGQGQLINIYNTVMYGDTGSLVNYQEIYANPASQRIYYSDIQGSGGSGAWNSSFGIDGGHNIDANPQLLNGGSNLQVLLSSPLRNKGNRAYSTFTTDITGSPRIIQDTIDIGAYETSSIVYVASNAAVGGDGKSWATALNNLQDGLDSAISSSGIIGNTREVWVKGGTYYPTRFQGIDQGRLNTFFVQYSEQIYGGFAGNETMRSQRNVAADPTILSGDIGIQGDQSDNAYHVVTLNEYSPTLDGFIIQDGNANHPSNFSMKYGGGITDYNYSFAIQAGSPVIRNCVFRNNLAVNGGAASFQTTDSNLTATFIHCLFYNDTASSNGGAVYLQNGGNFNSPSNLTCNFINCTAANNAANGFNGGFVFNLNINGVGTAVSKFYNSLIWGNTVGATANASSDAGGGAGTQNYNSNLQGTNPVFVNASNPAGADGNIFTDDDGLKLQVTSPAINGGANAYLATGNINDSLYDVTGINRIQQQVTDIGIYENWGCLGFTSLYVDGSRPVSGLGNTWAAAFTSLQDALQVAKICPEVDTIYIAKGTYYPGPTQTILSRDTTFLITRKMTVLGGYPNGGGSRNAIANPVILDGNINLVSPGDNAFHIMTIVAAATDTVTLDGLTFKNGRAEGLSSNTIAGRSFSRGAGAALLIYGPQVEVRNCNFSNNLARLGGACIQNYSGALLINNSVFSNSVAAYGAAIRTEPGNRLTATGNTFYNNQTIQDGCALSLYMGSADNATLINNQFIKNKTDGSGGAGTFTGGSSYVYNNTFYNNSAGVNGGGFYLMPNGATSVNVFNNAFYKDTATASGNDLYSAGGSITVTAGNNSYSDVNPLFYNENSLIGADNIWGSTDDGLVLLNTSPLINQGTGTVVNYSNDITSGPRTQWGAVDIGAFEADSVITRWYVSAAQDSVTGNGLSWATAFPQFTQGVNAAKPGDSVWVAEGVYTPASSTSFRMKNGVKIYGGFNATEYQLAQRLLAGGYNSVLQGNGSNVVLSDSVNNTTILDGFVIQNGNGAAGAGMRNSYSSPQLRNCVFVNNSASGFGGGLSCSNSSPVLTNVIFYNNSVTGVTSLGGAMYCANNSYPVIRNCDFVNNASSFNSGAIYSLSNAHPSVSNSAFTGNTAGNLYDDNYFAGASGLSHNLFQTGNIGSENIIGTDAGMLEQANGAGQDGRWFTADDGLQLTYNTSNLINRGINDSVINLAADITGAARIRNGVVDIGAYESADYNYCDSVSFNSIHILYVDANRPASGNGYSWQNAFVTLGEALDRANNCSAFDTICVAGGTYYPTGYQADTNRNLSFTILRSGYIILGGYPGGGGIRNPGTYNTTLSGNIGTTDDSTDNSYHVLVFKNVDNTSGIDGFIVTAGTANSPVGDANGNGGGAWINGSGTGIHCNPKISNCVFAGNYAFYGGAVVNDGTNGGSSSPAFINCVFTKNTGDGLGGAMYNMGYYGSVEPVITNCTFAANTCSANGGGIYNTCQPAGNVSVTLKNTILWGNSSNDGLADQQLTGDGCTSTASYCIVQGGLSGSLTDGGHNLYVNPQFADSANATGTGGNWMTSNDGLIIYAGSPAIDAGNALGTPVTDITGTARVSASDIGAYENMCGGTVFKTISIAACDSALSPNYSYWRTTSGTFTDTTTTRTGCDTVFTVNLTLGHTTVNSFAVNACGNYTSPSGAYVWDSTGVYTDVLQNASGCDSLITINLTIRKSSTANLSPTVCGSYFSPAGKIYTTTGTYIDTIANSAGCDSIISINLTILNISYSSYSHSVCNGESYLFNGTSLTATGSYNDTLISANGCDSIVALNLTVLPAYASTINQTICSGSTYTFNGQPLTGSGVYYDTLTSSIGCDSIITLNLAVSNVLTSTFTDSICAGGSYLFNGQNLSTSGSYKDTLTAVGGCDSIVTLNLTVRSAINNAATVNGAVCTAAEIGASYQWLICSTSQPVSGATLRTFTATQNGAYKCVVTSGNCSDTTNCVAVTTVNVVALLDYHFSLYPNPSNGIVTVTHSYEGNVQLQILNSIGNIIRILELTKATEQLDISDLPAAVYHVVLLNNKQQLAITKLIKQ